MSRKQKFDAKKVEEAFEVVKRHFKMKDKQILGRSRKEREMDKHFNAQTKEIKKIQKDKRRKRKDMQPGERKPQVYRLPGDRERIKRVKRERRRSSRSSRHRVKRQRIANDPLEALEKLASHLKSKEKFPKVIALLHQWVRDYLRPENRPELLGVLDVIILDCDYTDPEARLNTVHMFQKVLDGQSSWFDTPEAAELAKAWRLAAITNNQLFTDDTFIMQQAVKVLRGALENFEEPQDEIRVGDDFFDSASEDGNESDASAGPAFPAGASSPESLAVSSPVPESRPTSKPASRNQSVERSDSMKALDAESDIKSEVTESDIKPEVTDSDIKPEVTDSDVKTEVSGPMPSPFPMPSPPSPRGVKHESDVKDDVKDELKETLDLTTADSPIDIDEDELDWQCPPLEESNRFLREKFMCCCRTLFNMRSKPWAKVMVESFFQDLYYQRHRFHQNHMQEITDLQAKLKVVVARKEDPTVFGPMEPVNPVVDGRDDSAIVQGGDEWSSRQTGLIER